MKALIVDRYKQKEPLRVADVPQPVVGDHDVLVDVHAAGLNALDSKLRNGEFKQILPYRPPFVLGHDVAGIVSRVGPGVRRFAVGDAIYARARDGRIGTLAESIALDEADVALKPKTLTMVEAASVPLVALTAWQVLVERAHVTPGQRVLIHAGSGGVGTFAIQLAKHLGATVATTTSAANVDLVVRVGADVVIDYRTQDFTALLADYDVVVHSLDADTLHKSVNVLRAGGHLVSISGPPDVAFARELRLNWFLQQAVRVLSLRIRRVAGRRGVTYSFLFMHASGEQLTKITPLLEAGTIRPIVDRVFTFEAANDALAYVDTGRARGKVVVTMKRADPRT